MDIGRVQVSAALSPRSSPGATASPLGSSGIGEWGLGSREVSEGSSSGL